MDSSLRRRRRWPAARPAPCASARQLAVDRLQVEVHRLHAEEQRGRRPPGWSSVGHRLGDPPLGRGQRGDELRDRRRDDGRSSNRSASAPSSASVRRPSAAGSPGPARPARAPSAGSLRPRRVAAATSSSTVDGCVAGDARCAAAASSQRRRAAAIGGVVTGGSAAAATWSRVERDRRHSTRARGASAGRPRRRRRAPARPRRAGRWRAADRRATAGVDACRRRAPNAPGGRPVAPLDRLDGEQRRLCVVVAGVDERQGGVEVEGVEAGDGAARTPAAPRRRGTGSTSGRGALVAPSTARRVRHAGEHRAATSSSAAATSSSGPAHDVAELPGPLGRLVRLGQRGGQGAMRGASAGCGDEVVGQRPQQRMAERDAVAVDERRRRRPRRRRALARRSPSVVRAARDER